ncbi:MAG: hypothetical protein KatS3mg121_0731 [Gammaproteobacteria bacterium]|nr:MAG: hypothetical protein KatS3mg121_0731 [Gammaproteobacteria bacterium]
MSLVGLRRGGRALARGRHAALHPGGERAGRVSGRAGGGLAGFRPRPGPRGRAGASSGGTRIDGLRPGRRPAPGPAQALPRLPGFFTRRRRRGRSSSSIWRHCRPAARRHVTCSTSTCTTACVTGVPAAPLGVPRLPAWVEEGLAERYAALHEDGPVAFLAPPPAHPDAQALRRPAVLRRLLAARAAPERGRRAAAFYLRSRVLVHYFHGSPRRRAQLAALLDAWDEGLDAEAALVSAPPAWTAPGSRRGALPPTWTCSNAAAASRVSWSTICPPPRRGRRRRRGRHGRSTGATRPCI